jgi:hypothetical protein
MLPTGNTSADVLSLTGQDAAVQDADAILLAYVYWFSRNCRGRAHN